MIIFDRKKIEVFTIKPEIKAMTRKERLELLNRLFIEEYQGKTVTYEMLEREFFVNTNGRTRKHFSYKGPNTSHKEHQAKINICASGGYWDMISGASYYGSKKENKEDQNHFHSITENWHYFTKDIMCEDHYYRVVIDVNENRDHDFLIYSVALHSLGRDYALEAEKGHSEKEDLNKEKELIIPGHDDHGLSDELFTEDIIAEKRVKVNSQEGKSCLEDLIGAARSLGNSGRVRKEQHGFER